MNYDMLSPIVFAVTVWEAGNKCVDYYMTWRGNLVRCLCVYSVTLFAYLFLPFTEGSRG